MRQTKALSLIVVAAPLLVAAGSCNTMRAKDHAAGAESVSPTSPRSSAVASAPSASRLSGELRGGLACNRNDTASVFLARTAEQSQALMARLQAGLVAARYRNCQVEILDSCRTSGNGTLSAAKSCCQTAMGCRGDDVDCYGDREQYWFGNEREWLLNLPEFVADWSSKPVGALVVSAGVAHEYRAAPDQKLEPACPEATHVITRARFGSLRVEAEAPRVALDQPLRWSLTRESGAETLVDLMLVPVGGNAAFGSRKTCMGLAEHGASRPPASFLGEVYPSPPPRCVIECTSGLFDCAKSCVQGVRGTCDRRHRGTEPGFDGLLNMACTAGFGESCSAKSGASTAQLAGLCDHGGDGSARVCGELSTLLSGDAAVDYAWKACERGRHECERFTELLRAANKMADPRYERALRYGCAAGRPEQCCALGIDQLDRAKNEAGGLEVLREYCAESVQSCCRALKQRGYPVPARRPQPD